MRSFLICPVRGIDKPMEKFLYAVVGMLEREGWDVHFPPLDTDQADETGLRICTDNRAAIEAAEVVHVVWDGESQGGLFDLGMAFALRKPIEIISLPERTDGKSFQNMVFEWVHPKERG